MLIGAAGGLVAYRLAEHFDPSILSVQVPVGDSTYAVPTLAIGAACVAVSSVMALWPDLDKPDSFITHAATHLMWLPGAVLGLLVAYAATHAILWLVVGVVVGAILGLIGGRPLLLILRIASGGHRRLTHSLLVGAALLAGAAVLYLIDWSGPAALLLIVAWGQALHLAGDVVTPGGVALLFPLWPREIHLVPYWFAPFGELAAGGLAVVVGVVAFLV